MKMSYNELSTNIHYTSYATQGKLMAMLQTWYLLRAKKLTAGDIPNGKYWEEFVIESHPKSKCLSKSYSYLETLSKVENKETAHVSRSSWAFLFPVLKLWVKPKKQGTLGSRNEPLNLF